MGFGGSAKVIHISKMVLSIVKFGGPCKGVHVNAPIGPAGSLVEPGEAAFGKDEPSKPKCPKRPGEWL